jgi:hypothetical protein
MKSPKNKPTAAKLRNWRIAIIRQRAHNLGTIEAPDAKSAEAEAVKLFSLKNSASGCRSVNGVGRGH